MNTNSEKKVCQLFFKELEVMSGFHLTRGDHITGNCKKERDGQRAAGNALYEKKVS
jgi:hypothetical protein